MAPSQLDRTNAFFTALSGVSSFVAALPVVREIGLYIVPRLPGPFRWLWDRTIGPGSQTQTTPEEQLVEKP
ncbi:hypothetical protein PT974_00465 [Cladobotryum mycophilum]|uniref:Uncharacterized protein n=1 Tax=Cladobotryum mycophilum TaxID=491253 RepID=A0ABR0T0Y4_9HYPO